MNVVMVSNFMNHHQFSLCQELSRLTDNQFTFIAFESLPEERKQLGYQSYNDCPFLLEYKPENSEQIKKLIFDCDVLIWGSAPDDIFVPRVKARKLTFRYSERPFKTAFTCGNLFHRAGSMYKHFMRYQNKMQYMLCASAYTALDMSRFGCYRGRLYQWGYFPEAHTYDDISDIISKKKSNSILWCGRLINWKRPKAALTLAGRLKKENISFSLDYIGSGELKQSLKQTAKEQGLNDCVRFLGSMPPESVRKKMEEASIVLVTSNRREGWGAVVNEAMNSGCAVVGSHAVGSVPFLIKNGKNGLIYKSGDDESLYQKTAFLLNNTAEREQIGKAAYRSITELWNSKVAAERFIKLSKSILSGNDSPDLFDFGPCCKAEIIKDNE